MATVSLLISTYLVSGTDPVDPILVKYLNGKKEELK